MDDVKKQGRLKKVNVKKDRLEVRLTGEDVALLDYLRCQTGKNKSDIIRESIKMYGNIVKYSD